MNFTTMVKEELASKNSGILELRLETLAFINFNSSFEKDYLLLYSESAGTIRKIYKNIKKTYNIQPKIVVRSQKMFKMTQVYMLEIYDKVNIIQDEIKNIKTTELSEEEINAYLEGAFLSVGSVSDPKTSGYHLEFATSTEEDAKHLKLLLKNINIPSKIIARNNKRVVYIKSSEKISDLLKRFKITNSLFYFEDLRIYRDHKNMVNRLNNCEIANQEKTIKTGLQQLENIKYIKDNDLLNLLDERTKIVIDIREKYPESSYSELADIISMETNYKIGKSGINHQFIKIRELVERHKNIGG